MLTGLERPWTGHEQGDSHCVSSESFHSDCGSSIADIATEKGNKAYSSLDDQLTFPMSLFNLHNADSPQRPKR